jgi:hypothetical protein
LYGDDIGDGVDLVMVLMMGMVVVILVMVVLTREGAVVFVRERHDHELAPVALGL